MEQYFQPVSMWRARQLEVCHGHTATAIRMAMEAALQENKTEVIFDAVAAGVTPTPECGAMMLKALAARGYTVEMVEGDKMKISWAAPDEKQP